MRHEIRLLIVALLLMLAGIGSTLAVLGRASRRLSAANEIIVLDASPSIVAIDDAQAKLRPLQSYLLERRLGSADDAGVRDGLIVKLRGDLERDIDTYLKLPMNPGEAAIHRSIRESLARMNAVIDRWMAIPAGRTTDEPLARRNIDEVMTKVSEDLDLAGQLNAQVAKDAALEVTDVSSVALPLAAAIVALTTVAAAVTLVVTIRAVRRAESIWAKSRASLDRRAEELELFAGRVAHDLLSPLMTVSLAMDLASQRLMEPADGTARNAVARASRTLQRVRRFVSDLLDFARSGAKPLSGVRAGVDDAIREVTDEFAPAAHDAGVELSIEPGRVGRDVACSPGVLVSVLSNLLQNAIKYVGQGAVRRVQIRTALDAGEVRVEIEDTGPGIPVAERDLVFDSYVRGHDAKAPGLGLGLATVRRFVESHGGHVGMRPASTGGSVFWFSLPAAP